MNPQLQIQYDRLADPKNQKAKILKQVIESDGVNERMFRMNGFRMRLTNIRRALQEHDIRLRFVEKEFVNEFGREGKYRHHFILECDKEEARKVYIEINK